MRKSTHLLVILLIAAASQPRAEVFFSDDFENGQFNPDWTRIENSVQITSDNPYSGNRCSRGVYNAVENANYMEINPGVSDFWVRYYIYYGVGMEYWSCKIIRTGYWSPSTSYYVNIGWTGGAAGKTAHFSLSDGRAFYFNVPDASAGKWMCMEFHFRFNDPGQSNGVLEAWVDGIQRFNKTGLYLRDTSSPPQYAWISGNYSDGASGAPIPGAPHYVWIDDVVFSTERVGPLGGPPPTPAPTNTPGPTNTPAPTNTPGPINTPAPTNTPGGAPTDTPVTEAGKGETLFSDGFEEGSFHPDWTRINGTVVINSDYVHAGTHSARGVYNKIGDANYMEIAPGADDFHVRFFLRCEEGMEYWRQQLLRTGFWSPSGYYYVNIGWRDADTLSFNLLDSTQNPGGSQYDFSCPEAGTGRWICYEFHIRLNSPGVSDGALEAWIDGIQRFSRSDVSIRGTNSDSPTYCWLMGDYNGGTYGAPIPGAPYYIWVDDVEFATDYIGTGAPVPPAPTDTPSPTPEPADTPAPPIPTSTPNLNKIIWQNDFETGDLSGWTEVVDATIVSDAAKVHDGNYAVEFEYGVGSTTNGWLWKKGLNPERHRTVYVRWFQKWETGFTWAPDDKDTKIMLLYGLDPPDEWGSSADWRLYFHCFNGRGEVQLLDYRTPDGWSVMKQNYGTPFVFRDNQWECIEVMIRTNTVGVADGALALWINGRLQAFYPNVEMRNTDVPFNALMVNCWHTTGADHVQHTWVDDIVVSTDRIGNGNPVHAEQITVIE